MSGRLVAEVVMAGVHSCLLMVKGCSGSVQGRTEVADPTIIRSDVTVAVANATISVGLEPIQQPLISVNEDVKLKRYWKDMFGPSFERFKRLKGRNAPICEQRYQSLASKS